MRNKQNTRVGRFNIDPFVSLKSTTESPGCYSLITSRPLSAYGSDLPRLLTAYELKCVGVGQGWGAMMPWRLRSNSIRTCRSFRID